MDKFANRQLTSCDQSHLIFIKQIRFVTSLAKSVNVGLVGCSMLVVSDDELVILLNYSFPWAIYLDKPLE